MNVLILSDIITYSGVGQYMLQLGEGLMANKEVESVVLATYNNHRTDRPKNLIVEQIGELSLLKYVNQIHKIIKKYNISLVHCNHRKQAFVMRIYRLLYGKIPVVWTCHTVPYPNNWIKRILGYYGDKSIAISSEAKEWMNKELRIDKSRLPLILNGVDNSSLIISDEPKNILKEKFFKDKFNINIDGNKIKIIVAHGRLHPVKGLNLLIDAFSKLSTEERKNLKVVLSGDTDTPYYLELKDQIQNAGLKETFFFSGWTSSSEIFKIADLMVAPSHREGFPLAVIEAFFMKVPVIRTKVGGYTDMKDYCVGIPSDNSEVIAALIRNWVKDPNIYKKMTEKAYMFASSECTIKQMVNKTLIEYQKAIECYQ